MAMMLSSNRTRHGTVSCIQAKSNSVRSQFSVHSSVEKLKNLGKDDLAEELSGQYQGDIVISDEEIIELESRRSSKTGLIAERYRWTDNIVPFWINESHFSKTLEQYLSPTVILQSIHNSSRSS